MAVPPVEDVYVDVWATPADALAKLIFRFFNTTSVDVTWDKGENLSPIAIPSTLRPMAFDAITQTRRINVNFTLLPSTADTTTVAGKLLPGTGTLIDQLVDLNTLTAGVSLFGTPFTYLAIPYPVAAAYNSNSTSRYWVNNQGTEINPYVTATKKDWVIPAVCERVNFQYVGGQRNSISGSASFIEVSEAFALG